MGGHEHRDPEVGRESAGAEEALRASEERFRLMVQTVQDHAIFVMDPEGKIASWNEGAERILGYSADEVLGRSGDLIFTEEDRRAGTFERELRTAAETGRASDENWQVRKGGRRFWASGATTALRDDAGGLRGFAKIFRDLTERRQAEEKVRESEERLRVALAAGEMGTWLYRIPQDEQVLDDSLRRLMGLPLVEEAMTLGRFLAAVHSDDRGRVKEELERCIREACDLTLEFRVTWPDGSVHWLRDQGKVFTGPDGRPQFMAGAVMDITDRRRAEEALARDAYLLASLRDSVIVTDLDGVVTYWNDGATRLYGWTAGEMIGRHYHDRYPEPVRSWVAEEIRKRAAGSDWTGEFEDWRKDGSRVWVDARVGRVVDAAGRPIAILGLAYDLTERKRMEAELREQAEALREADRRKDEFLAMLGHELRNPLAPLRAVTETLRRHRPDGPTRDRAYAMMDRQVTHLTRLVDDLLDVSRITRGLVELRRESVELADVARQAVEMAGPMVDGREHDLAVTLPHKPLRVEGDAVRLTQVVFNLLSNAVKYTDPGGRISLTVAPDGGQAVVRVRDNGSGMAPSLVPRAFDLFTQGERTPDRSQGGLGLGLTLVRRLVEMHGGTVEAHSDGPGQGSEFVVRLPALASNGESETAGPRSPVPAVTPVGRALVVDDNYDVAESLTWELHGLAGEIKLAHGGPEAIETARQWRPDVILCDLGMPGMDGYETCRRLRQVPGLERVLIAAVSGYGGEDERRRSREAGFDRHLVKPIGRDALEELIRAAAAAG